jgi:2-haloalkanoic acid dehalogenase type II
LDLARIRAITIDLDDTLWPIWPTIARAETVLHAWLVQHAPATATLFSDAQALRAIREQMLDLRPDLRGDLSGLRRESIRLALSRSGDDPGLAEPAFDLFFAERHRVEFFADALQSLEFLSRRYPVVALSNGNADVQRIGIGAYFQASISASDCGLAKPDPRIFHLAAQAVQMPADAVLHVGDDAALDVQGALAAGMQAVWINAEQKVWPHGPSSHVTVNSLTGLCQLLSS